MTSQIEEQRLPAREEHQQRLRTHRLKLAGLQLVILIPLLILSGILLAKNRESLHLPFFLAFGGATLLKVGLVMHEYFPTQYFKYVFIGALLLVVGKLLFHFIRVAAFPKVQWLRKQYREAYEHFLCPVCEFPIRTGPRKYLYWTRRTLKKMVVPGDSSYEDENYSCPSCGTDLYEECSSCGKVRHSLLPHCRHCGDEKEAF